MFQMASPSSYMGLNFYVGGTACRCHQEFDPSVKEAAAWAIGYIAQHTAGEGETRTHAFLQASRRYSATTCASHEFLRVGESFLGLA